MFHLGQRYIIKGLGLFFLALLLLAFPAFASQLRLVTKPVATNAQAGKSSTAVIDLFRNNCARCHGADGRGDTPTGHTYNTPDFTDVEWWRKHSKITGTSSLIAIVSHGKGGMPAFARKLTPKQIRLLVNHVRAFKPR